MKWQVAITRLLHQLMGVLETVSPEDFVRPSDVLSGSSVGQHFRHIVECWQELNKGYDRGWVNYDLRVRDHALETDTIRVIRELKSVEARLLKNDRILLLQGAIGEDGAFEISSNYYRELMHNYEHAVHHMAMIRAGLSSFSRLPIPESFGVAYSTQQFRRNNTAFVNY